MKKKRGFWHFIKPTWIKMFLFIVFTFALPTFFKVCENGCFWDIQRHAGLALWANKAPGQLTFPTLFGLMAAAYVCSILVAGFFNWLGMLIKKKARKLERQGF